LSNDGKASLSIASVTTSGDFKQANSCGTSLAPAKSCSISESFTPTIGGSRIGTLTINDNAAGSPQTVSLSGTGSQPVTVSPSSVPFGSVAVNGTSMAHAVTVTNNQAGAISLGAAVSGADPADFAIQASGTTCGAELAAKSKCNYVVVFAPTVGGARTGTLTINDSAFGSPQTVGLSGTGTQGARVSPSSLSFGSVKVNATSAARTVMVTNNQAAAISLSAVFSGTNPGNFAIKASGTTCGATLVARSTCNYAVTFAPAAKKSYSARLNLSDSPDPSSPYSVTLSGNGS
jgi:hypothetical protein